MEACKLARSQIIGGSWEADKSSPAKNLTQALQTCKSLSRFLVCQCVQQLFGSKTDTEISKTSPSLILRLACQSEFSAAVTWFAVTSQHPQVNLHCPLSTSTSPCSTACAVSTESSCTCRNSSGGATAAGQPLRVCAAAVNGRTWNKKYVSLILTDASQNRAFQSRIWATKLLHHY